ncbi:MAG: hypothetical protein ACJAR2_003906 [Ilumatobacter sp.]|jgi:hypothetical protein
MTGRQQLSNQVSCRTQDGSGHSVCRPGVASRPWCYPWRGSSITSRHDKSGGWRPLAPDGPSPKCRWRTRISSVCTTHFYRAATARTGYPQSTATSSAWQISRIRMPLSAPIRSTSTAVDTDSVESRFTAQRRPIGSSPGLRTTSLGKPRIVVVHGAMSARRSRGMAASRDRTTTGRRPTSGGSHHHSSPRAGKALTWPMHRYMAWRAGITCPPTTPQRCSRLSSPVTLRRQRTFVPSDVFVAVPGCRTVRRYGTPDDKVYSATSGRSGSVGGVRRR